MQKIEIVCRFLCQPALGDPDEMVFPPIPMDRALDEMRSEKNMVPRWTRYGGAAVELLGKLENAED